MSRRTWTAVHSAVNRSLKLAELNGHAARLFFHQLLQAVDSHGCIDARPHILLVEVWPLLGETIASTRAAVEDLERVGLVIRKSDDKAEWLEIPDWNEKAGALIRKRGKRAFGAEPVPNQSRTTPALVPEKRPEGQHNDPQGQHQSRTASNSNSPSRSSLTDSPAVSPRVSRTREDAPPDQPSVRAWEQVELHPKLHVPIVHAAIVRWEAHLREHGKSAWGTGTWATNLAKWATWGPARTVAAIDCAIGAGKFTPFEPTHAPRVETSKAEPGAAAKRAEREARERFIERTWTDLHLKPGKRPGLSGVEVDALLLDAKYPGHEAAERELRAAGRLNGHASSSPATPVGVRT